MLLEFAMKAVTLFVGLFITAPLACVVPKKHNLFLFIGGKDGRFRDNAKYLYLHLYRSKRDHIEFYFLTENRKVFADLRKHHLPVVLYPKLSTFYLMLRASVLIVDNFTWIYGRKYQFFLKAFTVQLWHGCSIKSLGLDNSFVQETLKPLWRRMLYAVIGRFPRYDLLLSTSKINTERIFTPAFKFKEIIESGYPRNDVLLTDADALDLIGTDTDVMEKAAERKKNGTKILLYAPTFRDTGQGDDFLEKKAIDLAALDEFAAQNHLCVVFKIHPFREFEADFGRYANLLKYDDNGDVYPLLPLVDLLITDYSSIFFDFLYLDRPIVFFPYDLEKYIREDRNLKYDYNWVTPGPKCTNQTDLQALITKCIAADEDTYRRKRREIFDMSFSHKTGCAAERILQIIEERNSLSPAIGLTASKHSRT